MSISKRMMFEEIKKEDRSRKTKWYCTACGEKEAPHKNGLCPICDELYEKQ